MSDLLPPNYVACSDGHDPVFHRDDIDCPACKEISKRLAAVNELEVKLALKGMSNPAEQVSKAVKHEIIQALKRYVERYESES